MGTKGAQRMHKGCTSAGTDARIGGTVRREGGGRRVGKEKRMIVQDAQS